MGPFLRARHLHPIGLEDAICRWGLRVHSGGRGPFAADSGPEPLALATAHGFISRDLNPHPRCQLGMLVLVILKSLKPSTALLVSTLEVISLPAVLSVAQAKLHITT